MTTFAIKLMTTSECCLLFFVICLARSTLLAQIVSLFVVLLLIFIISIPEIQLCFLGFGFCLSRLVLLCPFLLLLYFLKLIPTFSFFFRLGARIDLIIFFCRSYLGYLVLLFIKLLFNAQFLDSLKELL